MPPASEEQKTTIITTNGAFKTKKPGPVSKMTPGYMKQEPHLWAIHGRYYDLTSYVHKHPGGEEMIMLGRGRDCTELFESVHCLSKRSMHKILAKFEVPTPPGGYDPPEDLFTWSEGDFYHTLVKKVRKHFDENTTNNNYKATWAYWIKVVGLFAAWCTLIYLTFNLSCVPTSVAAAFVGGIVMNMLGFNVMHDGSHYGISFTPWINKYLHGLWSDWNLWSHFVWLRHHVYGHHSYTGVWQKDPDLINSNTFIRKHEQNQFKFFYRYQWFLTWPLMGLWPNQHVGQLLMYVRAWTTRQVFGVPIEKISRDALIRTVTTYIFSLFCHFVLPFYLLDDRKHAITVIFAYWLAQGIGYFLNIVPNHDTLSTYDNAKTAPKAEKQDWGVQQVLNSGNHTTDKGIWSFLCTQLWGGMNYQIEHHLFPSVSHMHLAAISKYVEETCKEFGIAYTTHSWFSAILQFAQLVTRLSPKVVRDATPRAKKARMMDWRFYVTLFFLVTGLFWLYFFFLC